MNILKQTILFLCRAFFYVINFLRIIIIEIYEWGSYSSQVRGCTNNARFPLKFGFKVIGSKYINIGKGTFIARHSMIECWDNNKSVPSLVIGEGCRLGEYCHITCANKIKIGDNLTTGRFVLITDNSHGRINKQELDTAPYNRELYSKGEIIIGDNVWIGDKVTILPGVVIGDGVIIGSNAVVCKNIPPFSIVAGIPAKIIKQYN